MSSLCLRQSLFPFRFFLRDLVLVLVQQMFDALLVDLDLHRMFFFQILQLPFLVPQLCFFIFGGFFSTIQK